MKNEFKERIERFLANYVVEKIDKETLKKLKENLSKEISNFTSLNKTIKVRSEDNKVYIRLWIPNCEYSFTLLPKEVK